MALTSVTVSFDIADLAGVDFDPRRTKVYATTNVPGGVVVDTVGNQIRLGSGNATINADGTGSISLWAPGTGSNPDTWQTTIHIDYPDRNFDRGRRLESFGPFTITTAANLADLVEEQAVPPTYLTTVTELLDGYVDSASAAATAAAASATSAAASAALGGSGASTDHGNKSGTLTVAAGSHEMDLTGDLAITTTGSGDVTLFIHGEGAVTVAGDVFDLTGDPDPAVILVVTSPRGDRTAYMAGVGGGAEIPPEVVDPPTQPGTVTVTPTDDGYTLSWVASTVAAGYEVQIDGGTWVDSGPDTTHTYTGLTSGSSHSGAVRAYNSLGTKSTTRTWGPASVNTIDFDAALNLFEPVMYLNTSQGSFEQSGSGPMVAWTDWFSSPPPVTFDGPPLADGDLSSMHIVANSRMWRTDDGLWAGMDQVTYVAMHKATASGGGFELYVGNDISLGGAGGTPANETHLYVYEARSSTSTWWRSVDGGTMTNTGASLGFTLPTTTPAVNKLWLHGNEHGGYVNDAGWLSRFAIYDRTFTTDEIALLASAAGVA